MCVGVCVHVHASVCACVSTCVCAIGHVYVCACMRVCMWLGR